MGPCPEAVGRTCLSFTCPSRELVGYRSVFSTDTHDTGFMHRAFLTYGKYRGPLGNVRKGVLVSMASGVITAHALMGLQARGILFVEPGMETYDGMVIGEHSRETDLEVNPVRSKELNNIRAAGKDENVRLTPPRMILLEEAIGYVAGDELIEVLSLIRELHTVFTDLNFNAKL
jgi:GTP-binding protein